MTTHLAPQRGPIGEPATLRPDLPVHDRWPERDLDWRALDLRADIIAPPGSRSFGALVGNSAALAQVVTQIDQVAPTDATVLITGESGTGKELVAREVHQRSRRSDEPLIRVNCAAVSKALFESEFFGHIRGAFTGAVRDRTGRFELADGGTLFLDEIGEIPLPLQSKLLRVLQEGTFERIGDSTTRTVDVRVVAATNRHLRAEVAAGRFREDLFYRLCVFPIEVPPLRERVDDVPALVERFLDDAAQRLGVPRPPLTPAHLDTLQSHHWPGNVRELHNAVERAVITASGGRMRFVLPEERGRPSRPPLARPPAIVTNAEMERRVRANMEAALRQCNGRTYGEDGAAKLLGLPPTTLANRVRRLGLLRGDERPAS